MRHLLAAHQVALLAHGVVDLATRGLLVGPAGSAERAATGGLRAALGAVALPAITRGARDHLRVAPCARISTERLLDDRSRRRGGAGRSSRAVRDSQRVSRRTDLRDAQRARVARPGLSLLLRAGRFYHARVDATRHERGRGTAAVFARFTRVSIPIDSLAELQARPSNSALQLTRLGPPMSRSSPPFGILGVCAHPNPAAPRS